MTVLIEIKKENAAGAENNSLLASTRKWNKVDGAYLYSKIFQDVNISFIDNNIYSCLFVFVYQQCIFYTALWLFFVQNTVCYLTVWQFLHNIKAWESWIISMCAACGKCQIKALQLCLQKAQSLGCGWLRQRRRACQPQIWSEVEEQASFLLP